MDRHLQISFYRLPLQISMDRLPIDLYGSSPADLYGSSTCRSLWIVFSKMTENDELWFKNIFISHLVSLIHLGTQLYLETKLSLWNLTQLRIFKASQEHSRGSPGFPNQNLRQICREVYEQWSGIQTKTTAKQRSLFYIFRFTRIYPILLSRKRGGGLSLDTPPHIHPCRVLHKKTVICTRVSFWPLISSYLH